MKGPPAGRFQAAQAVAARLGRPGQHQLNYRSQPMDGGCTHMRYTWPAAVLALLLSRSAGIVLPAARGMAV